MACFIGSFIDSLSGLVDSTLSVFGQDFLVMSGMVHLIVESTQEHERALCLFAEQAVWYKEQSSIENLESLFRRQGVPDP
jgi:hypothetical protein